ncbi:MAG: hypothetical protein ABR566_15955 [Pyrinomonadaceae bacterium]
MIFNSNFFRFIFAVCLAFSMSVVVFADTIRLKDGSIIKGKIINFNGGKFTVVISDETRQRQMTFTADEVESIVFDSDSAPLATNKTPEPANKNVNSGQDTTVITVGQNNTATPQATPTKPVLLGNTDQTNKTSTGSPTNSNASTTPAKPIIIDVKVLADNTSNGWTNTGWVVQKGQRIKITGSGRVSLGSGHNSTAGGIATLTDANKLKKDEPTGGLIAVIGDDNNDFIFIGESREFVATRDGALFLGINEGNLDDNTGSFDAKIEIFPER